MIVRTLFGVLAAVLVAGSMSASTVHAKACPALCRPVIKACFATCTTPPKAKCKRLQCKKRIVQYCKDNGKTCPASPSGAFLD